MKYFLNNFEYFRDFEDAYLPVTYNSNLYYVKIKNKAYIAWENIDSTEISENYIVKYNKSYYDVISGDKVLELSESVNLLDNTELNNENVQLLSKILNVQKHDTRLLELNDIDRILSFEKNQNVKVKSLKEGKNLF